MREAEIAQALVQDPVLRQIAERNGYEATPYVLAGLALQLEVQTLRQQQAEAKAKFEAEKKAYGRALLAELRAGASFPATSKAGSGPQNARGGPAMDLKSVLRAAYIEAGGKPDPLLD